MRCKDAGCRVTNFDEIVASIPQVGVAWHRETIIHNSLTNVPHITHTIRSIEPRTGPCLVISAGPSLYRRSILGRLRQSGYKGTLVATDGSFIQCLRLGIHPDYVLTLDPHPTRTVRWFGDPDIESNTDGDDYFERQDLDISFRKNSVGVNAENLALVDRARSSIVICSTAPKNVVERTRHLKRYWFAPLVDEPVEGSLTRKMVEATDLPALNTGGTVGNAAVAFALVVLQSRNIATVGMDFSYYSDTPLEQTQSFHLSKGNPDFYKWEVNPEGEVFRTDATYYWYRSNLLDLLKHNDATIINCSEAGILYGSNVKWEKLDKWLAFS